MQVAGCVALHALHAGLREIGVGDPSCTGYLLLGSQALASRSVRAISASCHSAHLADLLEGSQGLQSAVQAISVAVDVNPTVLQLGSLAVASNVVAGRLL